LPKLADQRDDMEARGLRSDLIDAAVDAAERIVAERL